MSLNLEDWVKSDHSTTQASQCKTCKHKGAKMLCRKIMELVVKTKHYVPIPKIAEKLMAESKLRDKTPNFKISDKSLRQHMLKHEADLYKQYKKVWNS